MSLNKGFLFVHIPKTAGNSIQTALKSYSEDKINQKDFDGVKYHKLGVTNSKAPSLGKHSMLKDYENFFNLENFYKFVSIRNPWDRMLSWYFFDKGSDFQEAEFLKFIKRMDPPELEMFNSQYNYILRKDGTPDINFIIKFENLQDDFNKVCNQIGIPKVSLFKLNVSSNSKVKYQNFYNNKTKDLVAKIFKNDIEYFGYEF